jgi:hypothetical protein
LLDLHGCHVGIRRTGDHQGARGGHQPDPNPDRVAMMDGWMGFKIWQCVKTLYPW